jgi:cytochrome c
MGHGYYFYSTTKKEKQMKSNILSMVAAASLIISGASLAADMPAAGKAKCGACHTIDKKLVGPSFMDISAKYKNDKDAAGKIAANITKGGSFGWKIAAMPAKGLGANEAEIKSMSIFIAGLAK